MLGSYNKEDGMGDAHGVCGVLLAPAHTHGSAASAVRTNGHVVIVSGGDHILLPCSDFTCLLHAAKNVDGEDFSFLERGVAVTFNKESVTVRKGDRTVTLLPSAWEALINKTDILL
ncbi:MAG: hypothetical protein WC246_02635 [Candidatus Paceibacterota bacterium]|jgi:hypothetical protein